MVKVSIVMAYYNRLDQIQTTLDSINNSVMKDDIEVIIVDDASDDAQLLKLLIYKYGFHIKLCTIKKSDKSWINPCIPYNIGFQHASGDIIIIQNPEICHIGDVVKYISDNINDNTYMVFSVYASPSHQHNSDLKKLIGQSGDIYEKFIQRINYHMYTFDYKYYVDKYVDIHEYDYDQALEHWKTIGIHQGRSSNINNIYHPDEYIKWRGWYNHPIYNNRPFHFLSAITRKTLDKIGGFDESFRNGIWYDDNDFLERIKKIAKLENVHHNYCYGVHLYHDNGSSDQINKHDFSKLSTINLKIYNDNKYNNIIKKNYDVSKFVNISIIDNNIINFKDFKIAVVIKTYSDKDTSPMRIKIIEQCISSVKNIEDTADIFIHIDGSNTKQHKRILNRYRDKYPIIKSKINRGIGGICNYAMRSVLHKGYDICFMCDDDIIFKKDMVEKYCEYILKSGVGHLGYYPSAEISVNAEKKIMMIGNTNLIIHKYAYSGCMYSFTPYVVKKIGYLPVFNYKYGYEHEIFTKNYYYSEGINHLGQYDIPNSANYISLNKLSLTNKSISVNQNKIISNYEQSENIVIGKKINYSDNDILISIIIPYYNDFDSLKKTIDNIVKTSEYYNYEIIIVNEQSKDYVNLCYLSNILYGINIKIINVPLEKIYNRNNLLDPYNIGVKEAFGSIIIMQSPYIAYNKDFISYVRYNLLSNQHIVCTMPFLEIKSKVPQMLKYCKLNKIHLCSAFYKDNFIYSGNISVSVNIFDLYDNKMFFNLEKNMYMKHNCIIYQDESYIKIL